MGGGLGGGEEGVTPSSSWRRVLVPLIVVDEEVHRHQAEIEHLLAVLLVPKREYVAPRGAADFDDERGQGDTRELAYVFRRCGSYRSRDTNVERWGDEARLLDVRAKPLQGELLVDALLFRELENNFVKVFFQWTSFREGCT